MAQGGAVDVRRVPGQLCVSPTNLDTAFPHGGTAIGLARDTEFRPNIRSQEITAEEFGGETVEAFYLGERAVFAAMLWSWDADGLALVWPDTDVQADGTIVLRRQPGVAGAVRAGTKWSDRAVPLLFSPDNDSDPGVLLYKAVPLVEESAALSLHLATDLGVPMLWVGMQDSQGRVYEHTQLENMTL